MDRVGSFQILDRVFDRKYRNRSPCGSIILLYNYKTDLGLYYTVSVAVFEISL